MTKEAKPDIKNDDKKSDGVARGDYCIGRNSSGGTCGHRERDHGGPGGGCNRSGCGCSGFEPNT